MTLSELKQQKQTPMTMVAIERAIRDFGEDTRATITTGLASHRKGSNAYRAASSEGFENYTIYCGPRAGRYATEGHVMVIVEHRLRRSAYNTESEDDHEIQI